MGWTYAIDSEEKVHTTPELPRHPCWATTVLTARSSLPDFAVLSGHQNGGGCARTRTTNGPSHSSAVFFFGPLQGILSGSCSSWR